MIATIHHPITVDRRLEIEHAPTRYKRVTLRRWYAFTTMQTRVAQRLQRVITVSENSCRTTSTADHQVADASACTSCRSASTPSCSARSPGVAAQPGPPDHDRVVPTSR